MELAALVCSQAIRKNAGYAPIYNTAGLIFNELGQVNGAVKYFQTASELDPRLLALRRHVRPVLAAQPEQARRDRLRDLRAQLALSRRTVRKLHHHS